MKQTRIFLLDLNPTSGLASTLRGILESFPNLSIELRHKPVRDREPALFDIALSSIISGYNPDMIFLVLSQSHLKLSDVLF